MTTPGAEGGPLPPPPGREPLPRSPQPTAATAALSTANA